MPNGKVNPVLTVSEYLSVLESVPAQILGESETYFCQLVYRGQSDISYELLPTIGRGGKGWLPNKGLVTIGQKKLANENNYIAAACQRLPSLFNDGLSPIDLLARLQHYGIPTRLLDVTTNALAALVLRMHGELRHRKVFRWGSYCFSLSCVRFDRLSHTAGHCRFLENST